MGILAPLLRRRRSEGPRIENEKEREAEDPGYDKLSGEEDICAVYHVLSTKGWNDNVTVHLRDDANSPELYAFRCPLNFSHRWTNVTLTAGHRLVAVINKSHMWTKRDRDLHVTWFPLSEEQSDGSSIDEPREQEEVKFTIRALHWWRDEYSMVLPSGEDYQWKVHTWGGQMDLFDLRAGGERRAFWKYAWFDRKREGQLKVEGRPPNQRESELLILSAVALHTLMEQKAREHE